jgi:hypothetical protein
MQSEMEILIIAAITVAGLHTLTGPDHYLPFIALSKSRNWSVSKTIGWTIICGSGHVLSSVLLGLGRRCIGLVAVKIKLIRKYSWGHCRLGNVVVWFMLWCMGFVPGI